MTSITIRKLKKVLPAAWVVAGLLLVSVATAAPAATAKPIYHPAVHVVVATPTPVNSRGGTATVTARLSGPFAISAGTTSQFCHLSVVSRPLFSVKLPTPDMQTCWSKYTNYVKVGANPTDVTRAVAIDLTVSDGRQSTNAVFYIKVLGAVQTTALSATTTAPVANSTGTTTPTAPAYVAPGCLEACPTATTQPALTTTSTTMATTTSTSTTPTTLAAPGAPVLSISAPYLGHGAYVIELSWTTPTGTGPFTYVLDSTVTLGVHAHSVTGSSTVTGNSVVIEDDPWVDSASFTLEATNAGGTTPSNTVTWAR
jgi:hypothetical protein